MYMYGHIQCSVYAEIFARSKIVPILPMYVVRETFFTYFFGSCISMYPPTTSRRVSHVVGENFFIIHVHSLTVYMYELDEIFSQ